MTELVTAQARTEQKVDGMEKTCIKHMSRFDKFSDEDVDWKLKASTKFGSIHANLKWGLVIITLILSGILGANVFSLITKGS